MADPSGNLEFILESGGQKGHDEKTRQRIRKHVMRGHERPGNRTARVLQWELEVPESSGQEIVSDGLVESSTALVSARGDQGIGIADRLGAGRMDPFVRYPIEMSERSRRIVDDFFDDRFGNLTPFRDTWFPVGLNDAASFYQVLSNAALNVNNARLRTTGAESIDSLTYHMKALSLVRKRIESLVDTTSDGLLSTVIGFACYNHGVGNHDTWKIHMRAIQDIIRLRGGIETLDSNKYLRLLLFCNDLSGSATEDAPPRFPLPLTFLPIQSIYSDMPLPPELQTFTELWQLTYPSLHNLNSLLLDISKFSTYVSRYAVQTSKGIYKDLNFSFENLIPLSHRLLSISKDVVAEGDEGSMIQEAIRLGCLLYLTGIKRIFGVAEIGSKLHPRKLCALLRSANWNWGRFGLLGVWCLAMGVIEGVGEDKKWFLESLVKELGENNFGTLEDSEGILRGFMWYEEIHTPLYRDTIRRLTSRGVHEIV